jgi:uncharacterized coiled-coil DUF342 family protein
MPIGEGDTRTVGAEDASYEEIEALTKEASQLRENAEELAGTIEELRQEVAQQKESLGNQRTTIGRLAEQNRVYQEQLAAIAPVLARYAFELEDAVRTMRANSHTH